MLLINKENKDMRKKKLIKLIPLVLAVTALTACENAGTEDKSAGSKNTADLDSHAKLFSSWSGPVE